LDWQDSVITKKAIVLKMMTSTFFFRRKDYDKITSLLPPELTKRIQNSIVCARRNYKVLETGDMIFEVVGAEKNYIVNLLQKNVLVIIFKTMAFLVITLSCQSKD